MGARGWGFVVGCAETGAAYGGPVEPVEHGIVNGLVAWTEALHGLADCAEGWEGGRSVCFVYTVSDCTPWTSITESKGGSYLLEP